MLSRGGVIKPRRGTVTKNSSANTGDMVKRGFDPCWGKKVVTTLVFSSENSIDRGAQGLHSS